MHDKARAQTRTFPHLLDCVRHQQCLAVRSAHARMASERVQTEIYAAYLQGQISGSVSEALPGDVIMTLIITILYIIHINVIMIIKYMLKHDFAKKGKKKTNAVHF